MRRLMLPALVVVVPVAIVAACGTPPETKLPPAASATTMTTTVVAPVSSASTMTSTTASAIANTPSKVVGVDDAALEKSVDPCTDFYQYACGGWLKATPIPEDRPGWSRGFSVLDERNEAELKKTLEQDAAGKKGEAYAQKLGDFWLACMDEAAIEKAATKPLEAPFAVVDRLAKEIVVVKDQKASAADVSGVVRDLYKLGITPLFSFYSGQDAADATQVIGQLDQGGLGLPDRDYYVKTDAKSKEIRAQYEEHVGKMLVLAGDKPEEAKERAKRVMAVETELAKSSQTKVERRQPKNIYHRMRLAEIEKLSPTFDWKGFLGAMGVAESAPINVLPPAFVKGLETRLAKTTAADWHAYFRWHVVHSLARTLPKAFVDEDFRYRSAAFTGAKTNLPRWKRCVDAADGALGEALAQPFVRDHFGAEGKEKTQSMVVEIERVMQKNLAALSWMDPTTRKKAEEKLAKINNKIGFPDVWRNYDALEITRASYADNVMRSDAFELKRVLSKIGKPLDRKEWYMSPPTVNAYYDANMNEMVFPAGILQPPFFDKLAPMAMNYGAIGLVMGHELTHGFDDEGRQYDGDGNLKEWWSPKVSKDFDQRASCVVKQYDAYVAIDELHVDGKLTLGENIADLGGLKLAYAAYVEATKTTAPPEKPATFTPSQEFFLGFAQAWCQNARPQYRRLLTNVDPHSPPQYRVNGPLSNFPAFAEAFQCKAGAKMVRPAKDRCEIW